MARPNRPEEKRYPDSLRTASGRLVRIGSMRPDSVVQLPGGHELRVRDIPMMAARLTCGDIVRGIMLIEKSVIFCEHHGEDVFVAEILSGKEAETDAG